MAYSSPFAKTENIYHQITQTWAQYCVPIFLSKIITSLKMFNKPFDQNILVEDDLVHAMNQYNNDKEMFILKSKLIITSLPIIIVIGVIGKLF